MNGVPSAGRVRLTAWNAMTKVRTTGKAKTSRRTDRAGASSAIERNERELLRRSIRPGRSRGLATAPLSKVAWAVFHDLADLVGPPLERHSGLLGDHLL